MKHIQIIIGFSLVLLLGSCTLPSDNNDEYLWAFQGADSVGVVEYNSGKPKRLFFYDSGHIVYQIDFDSTGRKSSEKLFRGNRVQDIWYYPSGAVSLAMFSENNESTGKLIAWYESGAVEVISDSWNGEHIEYYESMAIKVRGQLVKGSRNNVWSYWDKDGNVIREILYNMGDTVEDRIIDSAAVQLLEEGN